MGQKAVFPLVDGDAEPVTGTDGGFDLKQQFAANGEEASADATNTACPVLGNLVELEGGVVNDGLNGSDDVVVGVADADASPYGTNARLGKAGGQFADGVGMKDAVRVDGDNDFCLGVF